MSRRNSGIGSMLWMKGMWALTDEEVNVCEGVSRHEEGW